MNCLSKIELFDVFLAKQDNQKNIKKQHYYVCVYSQLRDENNNLANDVYGLMITSNSKYERFFAKDFNDYNVEIRFNGKIAYVLCDKVLRIQSEDIVSKQTKSLTQGEIYNIKMYFSKFMQEVKRQTNIKE